MKFIDLFQCTRTNSLIPNIHHLKRRRNIFRKVGGKRQDQWHRRYFVGLHSFERNAMLKTCTLGGAETPGVVHQMHACRHSLLHLELERNGTEKRISRGAQTLVSQRHDLQLFTELEPCGDGIGVKRPFF